MKTYKAASKSQIKAAFAAGYISADMGIDALNGSRSAQCFVTEAIEHYKALKPAKCTRRVTRGEADVWHMQWKWMWLSFGRCVNGMPPLFDANGNHFAQVAFDPFSYTRNVRST